MEEPLTPDPSPRHSRQSEPNELSQDQIMKETSAAVKKPQGSKRPRRNAALVADSAVLISAAQLKDKQDTVKQKPASKKTKLSPNVQPHDSDPSLPLETSDSPTVLQRNASPTVPHCLPTPPSALAPGSERSQDQASAFRVKKNTAVDDFSIGSPRKRAAMRKPKAQTFTNPQPPVDNRPLPHGLPAVWADQRQALCETLPYYRSYQSGAYMNGGIAYGFLLDRDCGERAYMDEQVVITRTGGGCKINENGQMAQVEDQSSTSATITSFYNNMDQYIPVALIVGAKNAVCPTKIPHRYCVMDYFQVTDIWAEQSNNKACFKLRFEKLALHTKSWWAPAGSPTPEPYEAKASFRKCTICDKVSPQVFMEDWMCLNDACGHFWQVDGQKAPAQLSYNPAFLSQRTAWPSQFKPAFALRPPLLTSAGRIDPHLAVSLASWKGMACPECGRCNSRTQWNGWKCETTECGFQHTIPHTIIDPHSVLPDYCGEVLGHALPSDQFLKPVTQRETKVIGQWRIHSYDMLPGNHVTHFMANDVLNKSPGGAFATFIDCQAANMPLQRFSLAMSAVEGDALTKHFIVNYGMPYKYIVAVSSKGFSEAPKPAMTALARLTWAGKQCVTDGSFKDFNEELVLGYFHKQGIGVNTTS